MQQSMDAQLKVFRSEKIALEEELNETREDMQTYESIMDNMKLTNAQLTTEVQSLRESISALTKQDKENKKDHQQQLNKANEILSKYFTVSSASNQLNDRQLNETENKIQTLSQNIISATKTYE